MRRGIVLAVLACASTTARADDAVDTPALPVAARPLATRLEAAIEANNTRAFLARVPARLQVDSTTTTKAQLAKAIRAAGSLDEYLLGSPPPPNLGGGWTADLRDDGTIVVAANGVSFLLVEHKRRWHLASIERTGGAGVATVRDPFVFKPPASE